MQCKTRRPLVQPVKLQRCTPMEVALGPSLLSAAATSADSLNQPRRWAETGQLAALVLRGLCWCGKDCLVSGSYGLDKSTPAIVLGDVGKHIGGWAVQPDAGPNLLLNRGESQSCSSTFQRLRLYWGLYGLPPTSCCSWCPYGFDCWCLRTTGIVARAEPV